MEAACRCFSTRNVGPVGEVGRISSAGLYAGNRIVNNRMIDGMQTLYSEVTGSVWKIEAPVGTAVAEGATVLIVESMKMEIPVCAPQAGVVREIHVAEGEAVTEDQPVAVVG